MSTPAAIARAEHYAAMAPAGAEAKVHTEQTSLAQVVIRGANEWICVTIGDRGTGRTTASAIRCFNSGGQPRKLLVRDIPHAIRTLYVGARTTPQTVELGPDELEQIRPGDRITAINGTQLPGGPVTVTRSLSKLLDASTPSIGIRTAHDTPANLYPDSTIDRGITLERDVPVEETAAAAALEVTPRAVSRTVNGVQLQYDGGAWWTADRRYEIRKAFGGLTECENSHPVRLTPALIQHAKDNAHTTWARQILDAVWAGKRGFVCEGGSEHSYEEWQCWDHREDDYALNRDLTHGDSWADIADSLTKAIAAGQA